MCCLKFFTLAALLSPALAAFLYEEATIQFKDGTTKNRKQVLETRNVPYIDHHLVPNAYSIKVIGTVPALPPGAVRALPKLKNLSLPKCKIRKVAAAAFRELPRLKNLHLQDNLIEVVEENVFNFLNVENLYLQRNQIRIIRAGAFDNMPQLRRLHLNNNSLTFWDPHWFKVTPKLQFLHFRRNGIKELPEKAFVNLRRGHEDGLKEAVIYLSKNQIKEIDPRAFEEVYHLKELWLDRNRLEKIDGEVFANFVEVKRLALQKNRIGEVDRGAFERLEEMGELNLSFNRRLGCIEFETVKNVRRVIVFQSNVYCSCVRNLMERVREDGREKKVTYDTCLEETDEEN